MNQIFGCEILPSRDSSPPVFPGTQPVETPSHDHPWQLQLFAAPRTRLQVFVSEAPKSCVYVWGLPAHADVSRADIPNWCAEVLAQKRYCRFRELLGTFVVIVDDPLRHRVILVSDILGVRPLFLGDHHGRLVFGSDVWGLQQAGVTRGDCDYGAIGSWLAYGYNCTGGSLFAKLRRLPPGAVTILQDGQAEEIPYAVFDLKRQSRTQDDVASHVHQIVSSSMKTLLRDQPRITLPISGGFDSRYLLALSLREQASIDRIVTVSFSPAEGEIARLVGEALSVPVEVIPVDGSVWDLYDDVHHFMADGFPISKFVTHCIAKRYPEVPMVNGFMGDSLIRGSNDTFEGKCEQEIEGDLADVLQEKNFALSLDLLRPVLAKRVQNLSHAVMEEAVTKGSGKVMGWADLYIRQRYYISNNFLQHLGFAEALLPFYSWSLLSYKMEHEYRGFSKDVYRRIFSKHCPAVAGVPHASELALNTPKVNFAKCTMRWARQLLAPLCSKNWLDLLAKERCVPLVMLGTSPLPALSRRIGPIVEDALFTIQRMYLLEQRVKEANLDFDWNRV